MIMCIIQVMCMWICTLRNKWKRPWRRTKITLVRSHCHLYWFTLLFWNDEQQVQLKVIFCVFCLSLFQFAAWICLRYPGLLKLKWLNWANLTFLLHKYICNKLYIWIKYIRNMFIAWEEIIYFLSWIVCHLPLVWSLPLKEFFSLPGSPNVCWVNTLKPQLHPRWYRLPLRSGGRYIEVFRVDPSAGKSRGDRKDKEIDRNFTRTLKDDEEEEDVAESGRLFVRNLPYTCTEEEINELFAKYGAREASVCLLSQLSPSGCSPGWAHAARFLFCRSFSWGSLPHRQPHQET